MDGWMLFNDTSAQFRPFSILIKYIERASENKKESFKSFKTLNTIFCIGKNVMKY